MTIGEDRNCGREEAHRSIRRLSSVALAIAGLACLALMLTDAREESSSLLSRREMSKLLHGFEHELKSERRTEAEGEVANDRKLKMEESMLVRGKLLRFKRAFHGQMERQDQKLENEMLHDARAEKGVVDALQKKLQKFEEHMGEKMLHLETKEEKLADAEKRIVATDKREGGFEKREAKQSGYEAAQDSDATGDTSSRKPSAATSEASSVHDRNHQNKLQDKLQEELKQKNHVIEKLEEQLQKAEKKQLSHEQGTKKLNQSPIEHIKEKKVLKHNTQQVNTKQMIAALRNIAEKAGYDLIPNGLKITK
mmetsp:Transcript_18109/g.41082  ORF Transcript_18109/g.41082 Transcript_18109/m.41082 type:complete len:309 (-) Transcript_18109:115-1041(-)